MRSKLIRPSNREVKTESTRERHNLYGREVNKGLKYIFIDPSGFAFFIISFRLVFNKHHGFCTNQ